MKRMKNKGERNMNKNWNKFLRETILLTFKKKKNRIRYALRIK